MATAKAKSSSAGKIKIDKSQKLELYRIMSECRALQQRAYDLFMQNLVKGTTHLGQGQEAIAAAFGFAMREDDYTFNTYRGHNHNYVRGVSMTSILGELMGRDIGQLRGKGGSMHITDSSKGAMGSYAIIGAHMPIAAGAAWSAQYRGTEQVACCFFGDGTTNIGTFHEALNFAKIWELPVVYICENNQYMEYTPIGDVTAVEHPAADRASAYGLEPILVDGNDVEVMYETAMAALEKARKGGGPTLIEALTYRHHGHSRADPGKYRPDDEVKEWKENRDPLYGYRAKLLGEGIDEAELAKIDANTEKMIDEATEAAKNSPPPPAEIAYTDVFADGGAEWRN
ncbi:MAG: thiamine pyrophosphate-dependent dehydrogenase E1 component subunit alpha [Porticoccaceae bacterium]|jgi:acetoin:2,6-dichlorophenolindophenol oxidoreductase subunit alpha|nr:thiamine pyrophosphate-dependent dehydrogenase E1 component subunit alpha [Porticoccaceae bacterium]